jgi:hypothetical protein
MYCFVLGLFVFWSYLVRVLVLSPVNPFLSRMILYILTLPSGRKVVDGLVISCWHALSCLFVCVVFSCIACLVSLSFGCLLSCPVLCCLNLSLSFSFLVFACLVLSCPILPCLLVLFFLSRNLFRLLSQAF